VHTRTVVSSRHAPISAFPAGRVFGTADARVTVFRKDFEPLAGVEWPPATFGHANDVKGEPFLGNERAISQTLLPMDPRFDLAINIFTYQPGDAGWMAPYFPQWLAAIGDVPPSSLYSKNIHRIS
jgi:(S)-ureidoglycine aminohydrolase